MNYNTDSLVIDALYSIIYAIGMLRFSQTNEKKNHEKKVFQRGIHKPICMGGRVTKILQCKFWGIEVNLLVSPFGPK